MELADRSLAEPSIARLPLTVPRREEVIAAHGEALRQGDDGYDDPVTGLYVFTSQYLATRDCCDLGCRHCPYCD